MTKLKISPPTLDVEAEEFEQPATGDAADDAQDDVQDESLLIVH